MLFYNLFQLNQAPCTTEALKGQVENKNKNVGSRSHLLFFPTCLSSLREKKLCNYPI